MRGDREDGGTRERKRKSVREVEWSNDGKQAAVFVCVAF